MVREEGRGGRRVRDLVLMVSLVVSAPTAAGPGWGAAHTWHHQEQG